MQNPIMSKQFARATKEDGTKKYQIKNGKLREDLNIKGT
jgi:hypothetical protein